MKEFRPGFVRKSSSHGWWGTAAIALAFIAVIGGVLFWNWERNLATDLHNHLNCLEWKEQSQRCQESARVMNGMGAKLYLFVPSTTIEGQRRKYKMRILARVIRMLAEQAAEQAECEARAGDDELAKFRCLLPDVDIDNGG